MNIINRLNYEEYFLLYTDNELNAAERHAVEEFARQHPDLKIELEMLQQSTLKAENIVFHSKDVLLKNSASLINETNYEEYFILYGGDELTHEEKDSVEQFVYRNPTYQAEFEFIQEARLQADRSIVIPDKTILYRTEKDEEKVFVFHWWKIAAAAIVFIFLAGSGWYFVSKQKTLVSGKATPEKKIDLPIPEKPQEKQENIVQANPSAPVIISPDIEKPVTNTEHLIIAVRQKNEKEPQQLLTVEKKEATNREGPNIKLATSLTTERPAVNIQKMEISTSIVLQNTEHIVDQDLGSAEINPYVYASSADEIEILNTAVSKKNKLRGLFRKVSRVVEKTTNIEPGDGRGIRIANFEIALK